MQIKLSEKQEAVVSHRNKNMLVSAAAGSGKTAVLVRRIISLITDKDDPTDLDRMLIVTFTKAAAGEMKERIRKALDEMIASGGADEHIRSQSVLIHNARISTIHSFCTQIIKNYFYDIDIDPSFRTMEDAERSLMMSDCAKETLKAAFDAEDQDILDFSAAYSTGKSSNKIIEFIVRAYDKLSSQAWPEEWIKNALRWWEVDSAEELLNTPEIRGIFEKSMAELEYYRAEAEKNLETAQSPQGPSRYIKILESDLRIMESLAVAKDYTQLNGLIKCAAFESLPGGKSPKGEDPQIRSVIGASHNSIKDAVYKIREDYLSADIDGILSENRICRKHIKAFFRLLEDFSALYAEKKRGKNLMDFNDLEHYALKILLKRNDDGSVERTEAAKEIASGIDYVMTDEYQDSNDIQELILSAVSGNEDGINNRFMVGDIKQAVYGFRNASPEIFMEKYSGYRSGGDKSEVIDLHDNYRSSAEVINTLNFLFERVMSRSLGGVDYDDAQALHKGERPDENRKVSDRITELVLLDGKDPDLEDAGFNDRDEAEAALIASEIRKLMTDACGGAAEAALKYSDIAVLVRTGSQAEKFSRILQKEGLPAYAQSKSGYFDTTEVALMLNYIRILDNPLQDIPFASVLFSPIAGCTAQELALIRANKQKGRFYEAAVSYAASGENKELSDKLKAFFETYEKLLEMSRYMSVSELINEIYSRTLYRSYAAAMPGGSQRAANLDMLLQRAAAYEKTSYSGLFNFIRYIEELKKDKEDMGEANLFSEKSDAVSVMTIHKSKGLEFPVVFLSGCARESGGRDASAGMLIHKEMGIGIDAVDIKAGKKKTTVYKNLIRDTLRAESKSEELRVLYVALTRAKEKLYITAAAPKLEKTVEKALTQRESGASRLSYRAVYNSDSFIDIILSAFADHKMFEPLAHWIGRYGEKFFFDGDYIKSRVVSVSELERQKDIYAGRLAENLDMLPKAGNDRIFDRKLHGLLKEIDAYRYPYYTGESVPAKASVSDIKRLHMFSDDEQTGYEAEKAEEIIPYIPAFMAEKQEESGGAARGTAYHKFWKFFDYERLAGCPDAELYEEIKKMAQELRDKNLLSPGEFSSIYISDFVQFACSPLGKRMADACLKGNLVREQPFTALMPPESVDPAWKGGEDIIIQGVIDAYFKDDGGYVLVDYKTDFVSDGTGGELIRKYRAQLEIYADVLEKDKKHVKEKIIYSTHLKKCVTL